MKNVLLIIFNIGMIFLIFISFGCSRINYEKKNEGDTIFNVNKSEKYYATFYTMIPNSSGIKFKTKFKGNIIPIKIIDKIIYVHAKNEMSSRKKSNTSAHYNYDYNGDDIIYYLSITDEREKPYRKYTLVLNNDFKLSGYPTVSDAQRDIIEKIVMQLYVDVLKTGNFDFSYTISSKTGSLRWIGDNYSEQQKLSSFIKKMTENEWNQYIIDHEKSKLKK